MENTAENTHRHFSMIRAPRTLPDTCTVFPVLPPFYYETISTVSSSSVWWVAWCYRLTQHTLDSHLYLLSLSLQEPQRCLDLCEKFAKQYGVDVLFKQFNAIFLEPGKNVIPSLKRMDGFVNAFKYTNTVCALVFNLEYIYDPEDYSGFVNAIVTQIRNSIAAV